MKAAAIQMIFRKVTFTPFPRIFYRHAFTKTCVSVLDFPAKFHIGFWQGIFVEKELGSVVCD